MLFSNSERNMSPWKSKEFPFKYDKQFVFHTYDEGSAAAGK